MNHVSMTGRLVSEPERKTTQSGKTVTTINIAVKRPRVKDVTDFIPLVLWEQKAEYLCNYGHKGDMVAVTGTLTTRKWQDKDGNNRISYEVVTDSVELISSPQSNQQGNSNAQPQHRPQTQSYQQQGYIDITGDEDLPF